MDQELRDPGRFRHADWTTHLDLRSDIEIVDIGDSLQWTTPHYDGVRYVTRPPDSAKVRLYLIEGMTRMTRFCCPIPNDDFFYRHYLNVLPHNQSESDDDCIFGKWSRCVYQDQSQRDIEDRIAKGRPYSLDLLVDPLGLGLEHDRYEMDKGIHRPLRSLEPTNTTEQAFTRTAMGECVSICYREVDNQLTGTVALNFSKKRSKILKADACTM